MNYSIEQVHAKIAEARARGDEEEAQGWEQVLIPLHQTAGYQRAAILLLGLVVFGIFSVVIIFKYVI